MGQHCKFRVLSQKNVLPLTLPPTKNCHNLKQMIFFSHKQLKHSGKFSFASASEYWKFLKNTNNLLKNNEFKLKDDDEPDFAVFLKKL